MESGSEPDAARRRGVPSLSLSGEIEVIKLLHRMASKLESEYMDKWLEHELSTSNKEMEEKLDIRHPQVIKSLV